MEHPTVLVFVEFPDPKFPTGGFLNHLAYPDAELVGFYNLDDGESVQEVQDEYEEEFTTELRNQAEQFEQRGVRTDFDFVFNHDRGEARQKVAESHEVDAILMPGGANTLGKVLMPCRHTKNAEEKVSTLLNIIDRDDLISVDLIHIADPDDPEGKDEGKRILKEMTSVLVDQDIPSVQVNREVRTGRDISFELNQAARNYDLVVLGETEQDLGDNIFGPVGDYIVDERDVPVLILR
ncbi:universal stress protein [Halorussus litoreus]|uniref:universal stress protein n=1 Tax=Halorussus litoreus TaxID=1710536 RepID=UPI000E24A25C|nr:universal stress protein [Halorussus litoreus]